MSVQMRIADSYMHRHLLMHNYDIAGGRHIAANNNISAVGNITTNYKLKRQYLVIAQTSAFTRNRSAQNMYTETEVNDL